MILVSCIIFVAISMVSYRILDIIDYRKITSYYTVKKYISVINLMIVILILLSISFYILIGLKKKQIYIEENSAALRKKTEEYLSKAKAYNENISKPTYDFKNHITVINLMTESNNKVKDYIKTLLDKSSCEELIMT